MFYTLLMVVAATLLLLNSGSIIQGIPLSIHSNDYINGLARYQLFALSTALVTLCATLILFPESKQYLRFGDPGMLAMKEKWLGINGRSNWWINGLQLLFVVSLATGIFMFLGVKNAQSMHNFQPWFIPFILLFSMSNALAEELIYRFGMVAVLDQHYAKTIILIGSAILFGLPHFYGNPGGVIGLIMSGVLGYILAKASIETRGIFMAWLIHFVQDVIIFTALMMMNIRSSTA